MAGEDEDGMKTSTVDVTLTGRHFDIFWILDDGFLSCDGEGRAGTAESVKERIENEVEK